MPLISTRGDDAVTASQAILQGLSPSGGLYVPCTFPSISLEEVAQMAGQGYVARATRMLSAFLDDCTSDEVRACIEAAYARFDTPAVAPLRALDANTHVLELFHGPTLAFKDVALQLLPHLTRLAMQKCKEQRELFVLVATSGDTGKAALEGFADVPGTRCAVFYPLEGVSQAQRLQMVTQTGANTHVIAVRGNFDDAQNGVKRIFVDPAFSARMDASHRVLSSANSINFGRLVPQIVYYFSAYADLVASGAIQLGQKIHFAVPTGNFGNILAAEYARRMGLPVHRLLCASNSNNVLTDFLAQGVYDARRPFYQTSSPSMDILISSNLERLLFELCGRDDATVRQWMDALKSGQSYDIGHANLQALQQVFWGAWADEETTCITILRTWQHFRYLMDPHTAVAASALKQYRDATGDKTPAVVVSTASPFKFGRDVARALLGDVVTQGLDDFACCELLGDACDVDIPPQITQLPSLPIQHTAVSDVEDMAGALERMLQGI